MNLLRVFIIAAENGQGIDAKSVRFNDRLKWPTSEAR